MENSFLGANRMMTIEDARKLTLDQLRAEVRKLGSVPSAVTVSMRRGKDILIRPSHLEDSLVHKNPAEWVKQEIAKIEQGQEAQE